MAVTFTNYTGVATVTTVGTVATTIYTVPVGKVAKIVFQEHKVDGVSKITYSRVVRGTADGGSSYDTLAYLRVGTNDVCYVSSVLNAVDATHIATLVAPTTDTGWPSGRTDLNGGITNHTFPRPILTAGETIITSGTRSDVLNGTAEIHYNFMVVEDDA